MGFIKGMYNKRLFLLKCIIQNIIVRFLNKLNGQSFVLMFHSLTPFERSDYDEYTIDLNKFTDMINSIKEMDIRFGSMDMIKSATKEKMVFLTFDDGFMDVYSKAYPLLRLYNIPFCVFVTKEFLNREGYITEEMLVELANDLLCTIGSHTLSHPYLSEQKTQKAFSEIYESKSYLEKIIKKEIKYFAYPFGSLGAVRLVNLFQARKARYEYSFSTLDLPINAITIKWRWFLPRINVNSSNYKAQLQRMRRYL